MAFRKFQAASIFNGYQFLEPQQVLITTEDGKVEAIVPASEAGDDIQQLEGILSPGFINCHCHLELSHMKGRIPEKTGLVDFVWKIVTERHHPEEEILQAIADAEDEMLRNGMVAVGDICNNALTIPQKQKGRLAYYNFIESSGWLPSVAAARLENAKALLRQYESISDQHTINASIVPHAPYSVSGNLWQAIQRYFDGRVVSMHNQETIFEDEFFLHGTGDFNRMYRLMNIDNSHHQPTSRSSLQSCLPYLQPAANILLVHNTFTQQADLDALDKVASNTKRRVYFCLCINANQYIEQALPPVEMLRQQQCNIVLGTDSLASNWQLSIADEMRTIRRYFPGIALSEMLQWATSNGAAALQMQDQLGSFAPGKRPGIVCLDENLSFIERLL